jgi:hypothetical protein
MAYAEPTRPIAPSRAAPRRAAPPSVPLVQPQAQPLVQPQAQPAAGPAACAAALPHGPHRSRGHLAEAAHDDARESGGTLQSPHTRARALTHARESARTTR